MTDEQRNMAIGAIIHAELAMDFPDEILDALNSVILFLTTMDDEQGKSCGDVISREYLKEHIEACWINGRPRYAPELNELLSWIDDVPSVQPEQPTEIQDIITYLDEKLHPIVSPDNWNIYSELHDMISKLSFKQPFR